MKRALLRLKILASRLTGGSIFESSYYRESELTRLANLFAHVDLDRWKGMKVLEVGAGSGRIGDAFAMLGFDVTSTDGRTEHVDRIRARGREAMVMDLEAIEAEDLAGFDLVIAFGVLYHLADPERFLRACGASVRVLLLETVVCDSSEPVLHRVKEAGGWRGADQALEGVGCRPSPAWIEKTCREAGFETVSDISSPVANWVIGRFDWTCADTGDWRRDGVNLRKMWVLEGGGRQTRRTAGPRSTHEQTR